MLNSMIFQMKTIADVKEYYSTPVRGKNSYDHLASQTEGLPKNLQIIPEAIRFNPETDKYFGGVDALPGPSFPITDLKLKKRYENKPNTFEWPDV